MRELSLKKTEKYLLVEWIEKVDCRSNNLIILSFILRARLDLYLSLAALLAASAQQRTSPPLVGST